MPLAYGTRTFERQVTFVAQVCLKQATVVLSTARYDRLYRPDTVLEAIIILKDTAVDVSTVLTAGGSIFPHTIFEQCERAVHTGIGTCNTRDRQPDRFNSPHVVAGIIQIE